MARRATRNPANKLERWEVSLVKRLVATTTKNDQDILAYFTLPTRSINHARIAEIRATPSTAECQLQVPTTSPSSWPRGPPSIQRRG